MNTTLETPVVSWVADEHHRGFGPWVLGRTEGGRLLRHPITMFGSALSLVAFLLNTWRWAPVLQSDDILTGMGVLPLAAATFLVVNLAVTRSRRHGTDELYGSMPVGAEARTLGHLLSIVYAVGLGAVLVLAMVVVRLLEHPVGAPSAIELLTGPAIVAVAGIIAVAAGRWWPQAASGPVLLVGLAGGQMLMQFQLTSGGSGTGKPVRWLALWVPMAVSGQPARELVVRHAGWHLAYLGGLGLVLAIVALLRHRPRLRVAGILAPALALIILAAALEVRGASNADVQRMAELLRHPERYRVCEVRDGVRYCAFPSYRGWIHRWAGAIEPLLAELPPDARPRDIEVLQTLILWGSDIERRVTLDPANTAGQTSFTGTNDLGSALRPTSQWGEGAEEGMSQLGFDIVIAAEAVGLPRRPEDQPYTRAEIRAVAGRIAGESRSEFLQETQPGDSNPRCSALGQARATVALWLAASATDGATRAFRREIATDAHLHHQGPYTSVGPYFYDDAVPDVARIFNFPVTWGDPEAAYAAELLGRPRQQVATVIRSNWSHLTDPRTTSDEVARLFGLRVLPDLHRAELQYEPMTVACR